MLEHAKGIQTLRYPTVSQFPYYDNLISHAIMPAISSKITIDDYR